MLLLKNSNVQQCTRTVSGRARVALLADSCLLQYTAQLRTRQTYGTNANVNSV